MLSGAQGASDAVINPQNWDVSVKSIAHYPSVLKMMVDSPDWTTAIGQAYVNQPGDVMNSIQRLREKAKLMGYLSSNADQTVSVSNGLISIVPAQPQYIYIPQYNPQVVYTTPSSSYSGIGIAFGVGLLIGSWLNNDVNWSHHRVYYHGWQGGGWVGRSKTYARPSRTYVNSGFANKPVAVNRGVSGRDISAYRQQIRKSAGRYETPGLTQPARPTGVGTTITPRPGGAGPYRNPALRPNMPSNVPNVRPSGAGPAPRPLVRPCVRAGRRTFRTLRPSGAGPAARPTGPSVRPSRPTNVPRVQGAPRPGGAGPKPARPSSPGAGPGRPGGANGAGHTDRPSAQSAHGNHRAGQGK